MFINPGLCRYPIVCHLGRKNSDLAEALAPCVDWAPADYRWPNPINEWRHDRAIACRVEVTGTVTLTRAGSFWRRGAIVSRTLNRPRSL